MPKEFEHPNEPKIRQRIKPNQKDPAISKIYQFPKGKEFRVVGVDGYKNGWVAVSIDNKGFYIGIYATIGEVWETYKTSDYVIVNIP